ncbi:hypothetical protein H072_11301 [Dactylellina haptotyla CBS 200.50]|uniref:Mid2 domain-containing protein n=1 Tax=Dactylellina haptotyla (strain CBS 200.50) TaxID=1284197 RepID=S8BJE1_DACHA|nr:hypothetical protein H072_11301 [Dactylellina haptotyla CBS 200.50]
MAIGRPRWMLLATAFLGLATLAIAQSRACFFPDGTRANGYTACDPEAVHSPCCSNSDNVVCLSSKLCYNQFGYVYRGACTDRTWGDDACPSEHCTAFASQGMNILACNDATGDWCCADGAEVPCCQDKNATQFYLNPGTVTFVSAGLSTRTSTTSTSTEATTSATTSTEAATTTTSAPSDTAEPQVSPTSLPVGAAVGMGVGIGIPTILAIVFGCLWWIERMKRRSYENGSILDEPILPPAPYTQSPYHLGPSHMWQSRSLRSELSTTEDPIMELSAVGVKPPGYVGPH